MWKQNRCHLIAAANRPFKIINSHFIVNNAIKRIKCDNGNAYATGHIVHIASLSFSETCMRFVSSFWVNYYQSVSAKATWSSIFSHNYLLIGPLNLLFVWLFISVLIALFCCLLLSIFTPMPNDQKRRIYICECLYGEIRILRDKYPLQFFATTT